MREHGGNASDVPKSSFVQELTQLFENRSRLGTDSLESLQRNRSSAIIASKRVPLQPVVPCGSRKPQHYAQSTAIRPILTREAPNAGDRPPLAPKPARLYNFGRQQEERNEVEHARLRLTSPTAALTRRWSTPNNIYEATMESPSNESSKSENSSRSDEEERLRNLFYAANEVYTEEQKFIKKLDLLTEEFNVFLKEVHGWEEGIANKVTEQTDKLLRELWTELKKIREAHHGLLADLESSMRKWDARKPDIGSCIGKHSKELLVCFGFLNKKNRFVDEFKNALQTDIVFKERTKKFEETYLNGLSYLCEMDVIHQNVVRYVPLLEKYAKFLVPDTLEAAVVKNAILGIYQVVDELNQKMDQSVMLTRQYKLSRRFGADFDVLKVGRTLRYEGEVYEIGRYERKLRYFLLFSDVLVIARASRDSETTITNYECLPLEKIHVDAEQHIERERYFTMQLNQTNQTIATTYLVDCKMVRDAWVKKINDAALKTARDAFGFSSGQIDDVSLSSSISCDTPSLPSYIPDAKSTACMMEGCKTKFRWNAKKPHCRQCGWIMCDKCTAYAPIQSTFEVEKVCPECYESNMEKFWKNQLLPEYMVDRSAQKSPSSMAGVRVNMGGKSRDWKELFVAPPNGIRPKIALPRIQEESIASGTLIVRGNVGVERARWGRLQRQFDSVFLSLYDAEMDTKPKDKFDITNYTFTSQLATNGRVFELRAKKDTIIFRIVHSANAERWYDALKEMLSSSQTDTQRRTSPVPIYSERIANAKDVTLRSPSPPPVHSRYWRDSHDTEASDF